MSTPQCALSASGEDSETFTDTSSSSPSSTLSSDAQAQSTDASSSSSTFPSASHSSCCLSITGRGRGPPLAFLAPSLSFLRRRRILQCVSVAQLGFHCVTLVLSCAVLIFFSDVQSLVSSSCPASLSWPVVLAFVLALPGLLSLRSLIAVEFILVRCRLPELWKPAASPLAQRASTALTAAGLLLALVVAALLLSLGAPSDSDLLASVLLWSLCLLELLLSLLSAGVYCAFHCCFPHSSLSVAAPFVQVDWDWDELEGGRVGEEGKVAAQRAVTLAGLQLVPPVIFRQRRHQERLCVICMQDMEDGDSIRLFTCRHAFHQPCADEWLTRRTVCPLCVATVNMPDEVRMVEMTGGQMV